MPNTPDATEPRALSLILIGPDTPRRRVLVAALAGSHFTIVREFDDYLTRGDQAEIGQRECDAVIVDLGDEIERGLQVIENISSRNGSMTVMAYSVTNDPVLMRRAMQAGAREFLTEPLLPATVGELVARASTRRDGQAREPGKLLVFMASKGGVGVTTMVLNFALALTKRCGARVVAVDLDYQLGEIALGLGMTTRFSVVEALMNPARLDTEFLSTILLRHSSGLAILASPEAFGPFTAPTDGAARLFRILQEEFAYVVVDAGPCANQIQETLFDIADTLYLVTDMSFPALRNAHRILSFLRTTDQSRGLKIVANRFNARFGGIGIDETSATKALGRPIDWKVPNDHEAARASQDNGVPLCMGDSPITRVLMQMAAAACGKPAIPKKKGTGFSLFGMNEPIAQPGG
jgi:pilus assembly protein CpaE